MHHAAAAVKHFFLKQTTMEDNEWNNTATNLNHSKKLVLESGLDSQCRIQMMPPLPPTIFSDDTT